MQLKGISITNFRSIKNASYIPIENKCVIIGPNNEGKSNILQGIVLSLSKITGYPSRRYRSSYRRYRPYDRIQEYEWERDFPLDLQETDANGKTIFKIHFKLSSDEEKELTEIIKCKSTSDIEFILKFGKKNDSMEVNPVDKKIKYPKEGDFTGIINFFSEKLSFHYIPAIRPTAYSVQIIEELLEDRLQILNTEPGYQAALKKIAEYQKPVLRELSNQLTDSIKSFIPEVKSVEISNEEEINRVISRSLSIHVDDNVKTDIEHKGDGIKSLMAISLVNHSVHKQAEAKSILLALEEPESHLHPGAIHRLNTIINSISNTQQVIITTHSPLLVDRSDISHNIIVNKQTANKATKITDIRDIIGVHISDNLTNTAWVLLVEGKSDEVILRKWLSRDEKIKELFNHNYLNIDSLGGGSNLSYKISLYNSMLCSTFFFLDNDQCGITSFDEAKRKSLISETDGSFAVILGMKESEIEDMINVEVYADAVFNKYGISLQDPKFKSSKKKWSIKTSEYFQKAGKLWNDKIEDDIKTLVAECVDHYEGETIKNNSDGPLLSLISIIKQKIQI